MDGSFWTPGADALIEAGYKAGDLARVIAERIGNGCTRNMVIGRASRLRLGMAPRPPRPPREPKPPKAPRERKPPKPKRVIPSDPYEAAAMFACQFGCRAFTRADDETIRRMYAAYRPTIEIAEILGRLDAGKCPEGTVRQRIKQLGLRRSASVFCALSRWAPEHLRPLAFTDEPAFLSQAYAWRKGQPAAEKAARQAEARAKVESALAHIDPTLPRHQIICAKQQAGMTLRAIGDEYGLTRERVRQIVKRGPEWKPKPGGRQQLIDENEMRDMVADGLTTKEIAAIKGAATGTVYQRLRRAGIRPNGKRGRPPKHPRLTPKYVARMWEQAGANLVAREASNA